MTGAVQLDPIFSNCDLRENVQITIFRDLANTYSCRMTSRTALNNFKRNFLLDYNGPMWDVVRGHLRRMEDLQRNVRISHNQCTYLFKKFQEGVERVERADLVFHTMVDVDLEACYKKMHYLEIKDAYFLIVTWLIDPLEEFMACTFLRCMAEGEALLHSSGKISYNKAALALSSLPPSVSTFSKFASATRELDWIVDLLCCDPDELFRFDSWECEQRCRLVFSNRANRLDEPMEDENLEADVCRQNADRKALQASLHMKLSRSHGHSPFKLLNPMTSCVPRGNTINQGELEAIWRKRFQPSSCAPGSYSHLDAFVIDNPDTSFVEQSVGSSRNGASKSVVKCKWLGETVVRCRMYPKYLQKQKRGFLARVQHPNVVEWMGYAFKDDMRFPNCCRDCYPGLLKYEQGVTSIER